MSSSLWGATLQYDSVSIGAVTSFSGLSYARNAIDVTGHSDSHRKFISGVPGAGEVTFQVVMENADPAGVYASMISGGVDESAALVVTLKDTADAAEITLTAQAIILGFNIDAAIDDAAIVSITFQITGAPTINPPVS